MSKETLAKVVQRAISDAGFRRQLNSDPAGALRGFDLSADELSALRTGNAGRLSSLGIDQRMSKAFAIGGAVGATRMAQSDLSAGSENVIDDGSGMGARTVIPNDPDRVISAEVDAGPAGGTTGTVFAGDDYKFAGRQAPESTGTHGGVAPVEGSPEATAAELGSSASAAGSDAARLARLDATFNGGSPAVDASTTGSDAARLARLDATFNGGSPAVDASGGSTPTNAFIDESEGYLTSVGYDPNVATSAVTDAHDRGGENIVTRIADDSDASGGPAASEGGPNISS